MYEAQIAELKRRYPHPFDVQKVIDERGRRLFQPETEQICLGMSDAIYRVYRAANLLVSEGFPVDVTALYSDIISLNVVLVNPDTQPPYYYKDYVHLFGFNISEDVGKYHEQLRLDLLLLHQRQRGAQSLLREVFKNEINN